MRPPAIFNSLLDKMTYSAAPRHNSSPGMEPVSVAVGLFAISLEIINTARELYDLRTRYKESTKLITAIYSESMIVAASLNQLQNLLQSNSHLLPERPELLATLLDALTSCREVYSCLHEEVEGLAKKVRGPGLGRSDRMRWALREPHLKDFLSQIQGQQQALSLLMQGVQMESLAEVRQLVQENSILLREIASRSKSLRESHPSASLRIPDSVLRQSSIRSIEEVHSALTQVEFDFDDELVNSRVYKRAMKIARARSQRVARTDRGDEESEKEDLAVLEAELIDLITPVDGYRETTEDQEQEQPPPAYEEVWDIDRALIDEQGWSQPQDDEAEEGHAGLFEDLETSFLPFMPPAEPLSRSTTPKPSTQTQYTPPELKVNPEHPLATETRAHLAEVAPLSIKKKKSVALVEPSISQNRPAQPNEPTESGTHSRKNEDFGENVEEEEDDREEEPPQLPPRPRPGLSTSRSTPNLHEHRLSITHSIPSISSAETASPTGNPNLGPTATRTLTEPTATSPPLQNTHLQIRRKPLGLHAKPSSDILRSLSSDSLSTTPQAPPPTLQSLPPLPSNPPTAADTSLHQLWTSLLKDEELFIKRLTHFHSIFHSAAIQKYPALEPRISLISLAQESIIPIHESELHSPMKEQMGQTYPAPRCDVRIFEEWVRKAQKGYRSYSQRIAHAENAVQMTAERDKGFGAWVNGLGLSLLWFGKGWTDYLKLPVLQLDSYIHRLSSISEILSDVVESGGNNEELGTTNHVLDILRSLKRQCEGLMREGEKREEVQNLLRRLKTVDTMVSDKLAMEYERRVIVWQGRLAMRKCGVGSWVPVHVVLMDNYLFWGQVKASGKKERNGEVGASIWVLDDPIPTANLRITAAPQNVSSVKTSMLDRDIPFRTVLHQFFVHDEQSLAPSHAYGAFAIQERKAWEEAFQKASEMQPLTKHDTGLSELDSGGVSASEVEGTNGGRGLTEMEAGMGAVELSARMSRSELPDWKA